MKKQRAITKSYLVNTLRHDGAGNWEVYFWGPKVWMKISAEQAEIWLTNGRGVIHAEPQMYQVEVAGSYYK